MQTCWKIGGYQKLILFFSGWAMDENPTKHIEADDADICCCFDYRNLETDDIYRWKLYDEVFLIAWSTGVWAAGEVLRNLNLPLQNTIAINGTPSTIHNETGIPRSTFEGTFIHLNPQTLQKFHRRMVGSVAALASFMSILPIRKFEEQKDELGCLLQTDFERVETSSFAWKTAFVGKNDLIFPPQNQLRYWLEQVPVIELDIPHFPFLHIKSWDYFLLFERTNFSDIGK
jgi:pimeloyl-[acyl-carrier protein] methyl ester esterase